MVLDVHSGASTPLSLHSTTPDKIEFVLGGVGRNISECLVKLGTKSFMIRALGYDMPGDMLLKQWKSAGLQVADKFGSKNMRMNFTSRWWVTLATAAWQTRSFFSYACSPRDGSLLQTV